MQDRTGHSGYKKISMQLSRSEETKHRTISGAITAAVFLLLFLLLYFYKLITPNPPFPESGGGGGQQLALGMMNVGNDAIDYNAMGEVTNVVTEQETQKEEIVTVENGEEVAIRESQPEIKNNTTVITPVKPKEEVREQRESEKIANLLKKNSGKSGGGKGESTQPGQLGDPKGDPNFGGTGGTGTGKDGGNGDGFGPGSGPGFGGGKGGGIGINLAGRAVVKPPVLPKDTKEEGKVVVEITVDSEGNVIEAVPNGRGTTTSSAILKAKAKQTALMTKFNVDGRFPEQKGTITIIFSFSQ